MRRGSNTKYGRDFNRLSVLELIRIHAPITRVEIADLIGLTAPAVTNIVKALIDEGLVIETGRRSNQRGQPPIELDLKADSAFTVGLHLDRDVLTGVLVNLKGEMLASVNHEIESPTPDEAISLLTDCFKKLISQEKTSVGKILGVGLVTVGPLDLLNGHVNGPPNFPGWDDVPLRAQLADAIDLPVFLDNNATAAAIGEHWYGTGQKYADFLYVYIGLGVGGGILMNGRIRRGTGLNAGEFGHMLIAHDGTHLTLESYTSLLALRQCLGSAYTTPKQLLAKLVERDEPLLTWLESSAAVMAQAVVSVDNLLDLEAVIFGGRCPSELLSYYVGRVKVCTEQFKMPGRPHYAKLEVGRAGDDTAALGAAILPAYDAFIPISSVGKQSQFKPSYKR